MQTRHCVQCGYDLRGQPHTGTYPRCPECGAIQTPSFIDRIRRVRARREWLWVLLGLMPVLPGIPLAITEFRSEIFQTIWNFSLLAIPVSSIGIARHCRHEGWLRMTREVVLWIACFFIMNLIVTVLVLLAAGAAVAFWEELSGI